MRAILRGGAASGRVNERLVISLQCAPVREVSIGGALGHMSIPVTIIVLPFCSDAVCTALLVHTVVWVCDVDRKYLSLWSVGCTLVEQIVFDLVAPSRMMGK